MGDENPIHTLGDYSKPSHEGYRNTIELPTMAALAIAISSDSLDESRHWVAPGYVFICAPVVETTLVTLPTGLCGLVPYSDSDSNSSYVMDSLEYITPLPATSPFLYTNSPEASDSSDGPPS
ncbi:hypothetical protein Tco_0816707 [Tanacetum coccineum]